MSYSLLECPFCSGEADIWTRGTRFGRITYVMCDVCSAQSKAFAYRGPDSGVDESDLGVIRAVEAWNRRSPKWQKEEIDL